MDRARLWISGPDGAPRSVALDRDRMVIGRSDQCDICLDDEAISWSHLEVSWHGEELVAADLDSSNGTLLNGQILDRPRRLRAGDTLQIGPYRLELQLAPGASRAGTVRRQPLKVSLSDEEHQVARALVAPLLVAGSFAPRPATRGEVAAALHCSERTVQRRLDALARKLKVSADSGHERPRLIADRVMALGLHKQR